MKKLLAILPFFLLSCQKKEIKSDNLVKNDSVIVTERSDMTSKMDSAANGVVALDENNALKNSFVKDRVVEGNKIIRTIHANQRPIRFSDEFTDVDQQIIIKIKNFKTDKISGTITPENPEMNIRFNQIKLGNGDFDGPFGRDLKYDVKEKGEIWVIISKSNMASGDVTGKFTVYLE